MNSLSALAHDLLQLSQNLSVINVMIDNETETIEDIIETSFSQDTQALMTQSPVFRSDFVELIIALGFGYRKNMKDSTSSKEVIEVFF